MYERTEAWDPEFLKVLSQGKTVVTDEQKHREACAKLQAIQAKQEADLPTLGLSYIRDASGPDAFSKLSRYEAAIERSLYKALHELQRLQTARTGGDVPPPVVVDINMDIPS